MTGCRHPRDELEEVERLPCAWPGCPAGLAAETWLLTRQGAAHALRMARRGSEDDGWRWAQVGPPVALRRT